MKTKKKLEQRKLCVQNSQLQFFRMRPNQATKKNFAAAAILPILIDGKGQLSFFFGVAWRRPDDQKFPSEEWKMETLEGVSEEATWGPSLRASGFGGLLGADETTEMAALREFDEETAGLLTNPTAALKEMPLSRDLSHCHFLCRGLDGTLHLDHFDPSLQYRSVIYFPVWLNFFQDASELALYASMNAHLCYDHSEDAPKKKSIECFAWTSLPLESIIRSLEVKMIPLIPVTPGQVVRPRNFPDATRYTKNTEHLTLSHVPLLPLTAGTLCQILPILRELQSHFDLVTTAIHYYLRYNLDATWVFVSALLSPDQKIRFPLMRSAQRRDDLPPVDEWFKKNPQFLSVSLEQSVLDSFRFLASSSSSL